MNTKEKKLIVVQLLNAGKSISEIESETGIDRNTVSKYKKALAFGQSHLLLDKRQGQNLALPQVNQRILAMAIEMRLRDQDGGALIAAKLRRLAIQGKIDYDVKDVPSDATIERALQDAGLSKRPVGPKDKRGYPTDYTMEPGHLTIDGWGPWHGGASTIFCVTVHDRHTRLTYQLPTNHMSGHHYVHAIKQAIHCLLGDQLPLSITTDNGVGAQVSGKHTAQPIRYALAAAGRVIFIPPGQPWRNGRLENVHSRIEREFWWRKKPHFYHEAVEGLVDFLNYYNRERPHSSLNYQAPADTATFYQDQTVEGTRCLQYPELDPQSGTLEVIRLCHSDGRIDLWGKDGLYVSEMFAGQFLRVKLYLDPERKVQTGEVIWQQGKNKEAVVVAGFNHCIDRTNKRDDPMVTEIKLYNFDRFESEFIIQKHGLDETQVAQQIARVTKRPLTEKRRKQHAAEAMPDLRDHSQDEELDAAMRKVNDELQRQKKKK